MKSTDFYFENSTCNSYVSILTNPNELSNFEQTVYNVLNYVFFRNNIFYFLYFLYAELELQKYFDILRQNNIYHMHAFFETTHARTSRNPNNCSKFDSISSNFNQSLKLRKNNLNLFKCPINILTRDLAPYILNQLSHNPETLESVYEDGVEIRLIKTLALQLNFTYHIFTQQNANPGVHHQILAENPDKYDMVVLGVIPSIENHKEFDYTITYLYDCLAFYCPVAQDVAPWKNLLYIFKFRLWIILGFVFISITVLITIVEMFVTTNTLMYNFVESMLRTFRLHLAQAVTVTDNNKVLQNFLLCISLYGLIISNAYQSGIISVLTKSIKEDQATNMKELIGNKKFSFYREALRLIPDDKPEYQYIRENFVDCRNISKCLNQAAFERDVCVLTNRLAVQYLVPGSYLNSAGELLLYEIEKMNSFHTELTVRKRHYITQHLDRYIGRLTAGGIIVRWKEELHTPYFTPDKQQTLITLTGLQGVFILLVIGHVVGLITFVCELVKARLIKKKTMQDITPK